MVTVRTEAPKVPVVKHNMFTSNGTLQPLIYFMLTEKLCCPITAQPSPQRLS